MSTGGWVVGGGALVVLVATGVWASRPAAVDADLWSQVRPAIEARLMSEAHGTGYGETEPQLRARWFCHADAIDLAEHAGLIRAGVTTLCVEYGIRSGTLVECAGAETPQLLGLRRQPDGDYRIVSQETPPDGALHSDWLTTHFGPTTTAALKTTTPSTTLEQAARTHFALPADSPVTDC
ncbi:hypothetical protein G3I78_32665 [Streptomyces sp. SID13726]|nr:hypothetical protein [Streptomyces sp. SID13726]